MCCQLHSALLECVEKITIKIHPTPLSVIIYPCALHTNCTEFLETMELADLNCINKHYTLELLDLIEPIYAYILNEKAFIELTGLRSGVRTPHRS
jgi:hypothetical protein